MLPSKKDIKSMIKEIDKEIEDIIYQLRPKGDRATILRNISKDFRTKRKVTNFEIDHIFPPDVAKNSHPHWTPVDVATRALELLNTGDDSNLLDVGSGCGKFCIIASLCAKGSFTGIEQRDSLVEVARKVASEFQSTNVSFIHGDMADLDWSPFNCFYFFNPFYENKMGTSFWIDDSIPINMDLFNSYVQSVERKLQTTKIGTRVVTYHGFGGSFPSDFICLMREEIWSGQLELWVKVDSNHNPGKW